MSDDPNQKDRLLELVFGLLPEGETDKLRAEIEEDPVLAEAYAAAEADAGLMGEAAQVQSPQIVLNRPDPNGRESGPTTAPLPTAPGPESAPWSRWAQWGLVAAASLLILLSLVGWRQRRSVLAGAGADQLRLQVTGPSQVQSSVDNQYSITTTTVTGRPVSANVHFAVYSADGTQLLGHTEKTTDDGTLQVDIPANAELPDAVRIEIEAGEETSRQVAESRLPVRRQPLSTYLRLDRPHYAPGETVLYRSVSLSRFHLEPEGEFPVHFEVLGPQGNRVEGSDHQTLVERGVATGEFPIPNDASGGIYTLLASSPTSAFAGVRREFRVHEFDEAELQKDLEFADVGYGPGMDASAALRVTRRDGTAVSEAAVQLAAKVGEEIVYEDSTTTDSDGTVALSFRLPEELPSSNPVLIVTVDDGTVREVIVEPVPMGQRGISVEFFPEGGDLAAVGENRVYFSARDSNDDPVNVNGWIVDEAGNYHAKVETVREGRGVFRLSPRVGVRYRLILESPEDTKVDGRLPFVMPTQKIVLNTGRGIFEPREPIEFNVRASHPRLPLVAMASCRGVDVGSQAFLTKASENGNGRAAANAVAIVLPDSASGVIRLTIFDYSATPPRPVAERLVYRRPLARLNVAFATDRDLYGPGDSCHLGVSVSDEEGRPVEALLGLSVVDEAVLETVKSSPTTMSSYFWLTSEIEHPQDLEDANFLLEDTPEAEVALDLLLGTQGWRRFTERTLEEWRRNEMAGEPSGQRVALDAETSPPLMLDNLSSLLASSGGTKPPSTTGGNLLVTLTVLGGAGMLVLVTMLSLLKVANGARLWAPATIAVGVSFFLVFLTISPEPSTGRAVAFQSYRPSERLGDSETLDENRASSEAKESGSFPVAAPVDEEQSPPIPAAKMEIAPGSERFEEKAKPDVEAAPVIGQEDRDSTTEEPAGAMQAAKPKLAPADSPRRNRPDRRRPDDDKPEAKDGQDDVPAPEAAPDEPPPVEMEAPQPMGVAGQLQSKKLAREKQDTASGMTDRLILREYRLEPSPSTSTRTDFAKTVLWTPLLETDAKGQAQLTFDLSDSVTRFRAIGDAHGSGRIGSALSTIVSTLPFHMSPTLPEEVTLGDRVDIPLVITEESSEKREVRISVETTGGLQLIGPTELTSQLAGATRDRRIFSAEAVTLSERAVVRFRGQAGPLVDDIQRHLRIEPPGYPQTNTISGVLENEQELSVEIPEDAVPGSVNASLTVFPSLAADLRLGLRSIRGESLDAALAKLIVADLLIDYLRRNAIAAPDGLRLAKRCRTDALQHLGEFRDSGGGYSRVEGGTPDIAASAEAVLALRADQATIAGSAALAEKAVPWLLDTQSSSQDATALTARAWRLWALAESGQPDLKSELEQVSARAIEAKDAQQIALAALAADRLEHELGGKLHDALAEQQADDGRLVAGDVSDTEMTALAALAWLSQTNHAKPAADAVQWLLAVREEPGGFGSNRATALALFALVMHGREVGDGEITLRLNGEVLGERDIEADRRQAIVLDDFSAKLKPGRNLIQVGLPEGSRLPYMLTLRYHGRERPAVSDACPLRLRVDLDKAKVEEGQTVRLNVHLENTSKKASPSAVAEIGVPAGLEIAPSLLEAQKKAGRITAYETRPRRMVLSWGALQPGDQVELAFDATASVPGEFSAPPSSVHLLHNPTARHWQEPLAIEIDARK
jgi:alpha-2-macroglobulin family protein/MG2 domain-containing protein